MADIDRDRLRRDAAGVGPYARDAEQLVPLGEMGGWDVAEGEPDIRNWEVRTIGGRELGKVKELLIDPDAGEVVMIDVDLTGSDRHALVPLRIVEVDRRARVLRMDSADLTPAEREAVAEAASAEGASLKAGERARSGERAWPETGRVRYPRENDEKVVERRPVVEEVVVRRRVLEHGETPSDAERPKEQKDEPNDRIDRVD